jgi:hypothetical protein
MLSRARNSAADLRTSWKLLSSAVLCLHAGGSAVLLSLRARRPAVAVGAVLEGRWRWRPGCYYQSKARLTTVAGSAGCPSAAGVSSKMPVKRTLEATKPADSSTTSAHGSQQHSPKRSCLEGAAADQPEVVSHGLEEAPAAATAADNAGAAAGAPALTPQQARVIAKWEERWEQLELHHKHGPRCSAPAAPTTTCPPGLVRVVVKALPPKDQQDPAALAEWVPKRGDSYYLAPDGRHENTLKKLRASCPYLDWGEEQADAAATKAAGSSRAPRQPWRSFLAGEHLIPTAAPLGTHVAAAPMDAAPDVAGEGKHGASAPVATPQSLEQPGGSHAADAGGAAAGIDNAPPATAAGASAAAAPAATAAPAAPSSMAAGDQESGEALVELLGVSQHLVSDGLVHSMLCLQGGLVACACHQPARQCSVIQHAVTGLPCVTVCLHHKHCSSVSHHTR